MLTNTERQQIVEEVNAGTYGIDEALDDIAAAQKGEEVRKALYAEALVLNREGHAGSTDMIARQKIANLQTSVNGQISTLRTEVGEDIDDLETALNSGIATQNGRIAAQNATIANVVANYNVEYGSTELWASTGETGALAAGTTVTLSEDVSHFDYIDIYSFCGNSNVLDTVPVDAKLQSSQGYALRWVNLSDPGSGSYKAYVRIIETRLHIIGTTLTIDHQVTYRNGEEVNISGAEITQSNRSTYMGELGIMKVVGRKITANTEIEDVRIGADGTTYNSAGQAVRAQVTALESAIPAVDSTLSTQGAAADAKIVGDELTNVKADLAEYEQIFTADVDESVSNWLNEHPEATTTVQDGSITKAKLSSDVTDEIAEKVSSFDIGFYDEITSKKARTNETDVYYAFVPMTDSKGDVIDLYLDYDTTRNPLEQADYNHTSLTINGNASILMSDGTYKHGISICNGVVINRRSFENAVADYLLYIGVKKDRSILEYKMNSSITPEEMLSDGCWNVFNCYFKLVENGTVVDYDGYNLNGHIIDASNESGGIKMLMGIKPNNDVVFLCNDGRTEINKGLTYRQAGELLIAQGCTDVYNLDGGGSSSMIVKGSKLNRNIDGDGTEVRAIPYTINVKKESENDGVLDAYAKIGEEKQNLIQQIVPAINHLSGKFDGDVVKNIDIHTMMLSGRYYVSSGCTNCPAESSSKYGMLDVLRRSDSDSHYKHLFYPYNSNEIWVENYANGEWSEWEKVPSATSINELSDKFGLVSFPHFSVAKDATKTFNVPNSTHFVLFINGTDVSMQGAWIVSSSSTGTVRVKEIVNASAISYTVAKNEMTITNSGSAYAYFTEMITNGAGITEVVS